ncbi:DUF6630 family protein [Pseudomonas citri]|uniref:DUF6630 family protein n=1 Tax=Pseudomonas citri TaxID=2978349 RepID=UPI0021B5FD92|nr:hypothetical protein [Pseudomonas citri]
MNPIDLLSFQRITRAHGELEGGVYFDAQESLTHEVFPERIVFQTNYLDYRSYDVHLADGRVRVLMTRLDDYERGDKAQVIEDDMDEEDWEELGSLWERLSRDLDTEQGPPLAVADTLADLFYYLFDETHADTLAQNIPAPTGQWDWAWTQLQSALAEANRLAEFEWKEWPTQGVGAVNALAPLRRLGIEIATPDAKAVDAVNRADHWERALLQYFNAQLDAHDLKLLAIGTHFDEYQTFACLSMNGLALANALEVMERLGIVYEY